MCVIVAKRINLYNSDKKRWFLYKIRDRVYRPTLDTKISSKDGVESVFLIDTVNDWTEGVNSHGIMIVSSALQNHADEKDGEENPDPTKPMRVSRNGFILRQCLRKKNIKDIIHILRSELFTGNTFISDGDRLFVMECYIKQDAIDRETDSIVDIESIKFASEIHQIVMKGIKSNDYVVKVVEITDSDLVVRTNHGEILPEAGFQKTDEDPDGWKSSKSRYQIVYDSMDDMDEKTHPFEILTILKNLGDKKVHKDPEMRPIRIFPDTKYFSGCIVMLTSIGSLYVLPIECDFKSGGTDPNKENGVSVVILPKRLPLFESGRRCLVDHINIQQLENQLGYSI